MALYIVVLLGVVQGAFMFLPVSSTAHLVLTQHWLIGQGADLPPPEGAEMILFDLVVHVGTLVSIVIVVRRSLRRFADELGTGMRALLVRPAPVPLPRAIRLVLLLLLSVLVTGLLGLALKLWFEAIFARPAMVAVTLAVTGALLWVSDHLPRRRRGLRELGPGTAIGVGVAQAAALMPGISRSGITIVVALLCGLKRRWAAEYSFFLAIPTILAATLVQALELRGLEAAPRIGAVEMLVGFLVAAAVGTVALYLVVRLLRRACLRIFSWYLWLLAALVAFGWIPLGAP